MRYFDEFSSNTLAASGNQNWFKTEGCNVKYTSKTFYRIFAGGEYNYSFLFSNVIDSTYADGSHGYANFLCDEWEIIRLSCCVCDMVDENVLCSENITFNGKYEKTVAPGELFCSDPVKLKAKSGDYICLEMVFCGEKLPYFEEIIIPTFVEKNGSFVPDKKTPIAAMIGCDRYVEKKIAFWGDSITEGIGTEVNSYDNWAARIADIVGTKYSFWNLGIGYGRAADAATGGGWMYKARHMDFVSVCFGVNDIAAMFTAQEIKNNLKKIITELRQYGCKAGIFTVPPFDFTGEKLDVWEEVNNFIKNELFDITEYVFDVVPILGGESGKNNISKYGGHPNSEGCQKLAKAFCKAIKL